jgi:hypothetical protein
MVLWRRVRTSVISFTMSKAGGRADRLFVPPRSRGMILMNFLGRICSEWVSGKLSDVRKKLLVSLSK